MDGAGFFLGPRGPRHARCLSLARSRRATAVDDPLRLDPAIHCAVAVRDQITPLIITYNEAPNIRRALDKLLWAERIVVIDSGSTDATVEILRNYPQVEVIEHPFA